MKLFAAVALALATLGTAAGAAPTDQYVAIPAATPAKASLITRTTVWHLQNGALVAGQAPERPAVLCELVVRQVGALTSFTVAGQAYDPDQLARCNAKAKKG